MSFEKMTLEELRRKTAEQVAAAKKNDAYFEIGTTWDFHLVNKDQFTATVRGRSDDEKVIRVEFGVWEIMLPLSGIVAAYRRVDQ